MNKKKLFSLFVLINALGCFEATVKPCLKGDNTSKNAF